MAPDGSYVKEYWEADETYFTEQGPPIYVVTKELDYSLKENQEAIFELCNKVQQSKWIRPPFSSWMDSYFQWLATTGYPLNVDNRPANKSDFMMVILGFMKDALINDKPLRIE